MALKINRDGTIECNTVRFNYKQCRNLVLDNCGSYKAWVFDANGIIPEKYNGMSCFYHSSRTWNMMYRTPYITPISNHKYYGCQLFKSLSGFTCADGRMEWGGQTMGMSFTQKVGVDTDNEWVLLSSIQTAPNGAESESWYIRDFTVNATADCWTTKLIIVDLTANFGAGNEPSKEWCDLNILELSKLTTPALNTFTDGQFNIAFNFYDYNAYAACYNFDTLISIAGNRPDLPINYNIDMNVKDSTKIDLAQTIEMQRNDRYYYMIERQEVMYQYGNRQLAVWFPIQPPIFASMYYVDRAEYFNGGGELARWKRYSAINTRSEFEDSQDYQYRTEFYGHSTGEYESLTESNMYDLNYVLEDYYRFFNIDMGETTEMTQYWCDRYIGGQSDCIIRIKDPNNKSIKLNTSYDIICNDIEIDPEINTVKYKPDGTIVCRKLIKAQAY